MTQLSNVLNRCQLPQDPCLKNPCLNDGECIAKHQYYRLCKCGEGFSGVDCEIDLSKEHVCEMSSVYTQITTIIYDLCAKIINNQEHNISHIMILAMTRDFQQYGMCDW